MKSPSFTMRIDLSQCAGMYQLNGNILELGIPMEVQMAAPVDVKLPVNHWMQKGRNELLMAVFPTEDTGYSAEARCRMTLLARDAQVEGSEPVAIASLEFSGKGVESGTALAGNTSAACLASASGYAPSAKGDVVVEEAQLEPDPRGFWVARRSVTLPKLTLPRWKHIDSDPITDMAGVDLSGTIDDETREKLQSELLSLYREIWQALEKQDVKRILPRFDERNREIDAAFGKASGATAEALERSLVAAAGDKRMTLWPITDDNIQVDVHDNDRLVRLMQNDRRPLISFDIEGGGSESFDIVFRKSGAKWIISR